MSLETPANKEESGLQAERTTLAWHRTSLSFCAVAALLAHQGLTDGVDVARLVTAAVLACVGVTSAAASRWHHRLTGTSAHPPTCAPRWLTALLSGAATAGAIVTLFDVTR